jgi:hypothetical protein
MLLLDLNRVNHQSQNSRRLSDGQLTTMADKKLVALITGGKNT